MNRVTFIGRMVADPETKTLQSGTTVCNFSIAVDRRFKKEGQPTADFFNCMAFSKTGEFIGKWFTKGKMIALEGSLQNRSWEDSEKKKRYATEVLVDNVEFCGDKSTESSSANNNSQKPTNTYEPIENDSEDDLPF